MERDMRDGHTKGRKGKSKRGKNPKNPQNPNLKNEQRNTYQNRLINYFS